MKRKIRNKKITRPPLQIEDFMCRRCRVQATRDGDHICGICKAFGRSVEPAPERVWHLENSFAAKFAESLDHWFRVHHLIGLNEAAQAVQKEE